MDIGADGARGDAIDLGATVGAQFTDHDHGVRVLDSGFDKDYEAFLPGWLVLVDAAGHRFVDETAPYGVLGTLVRAHGDRVFAVFDQHALDTAATWGGRGPRSHAVGTIGPHTERARAARASDVVDRVVEHPASGVD